MGLLASEKFKPVLFVGLGGNGGKIVNQLSSRLRRHPNWERIAPMTHFVVVDTNKDDLDKHKDVPPDCRFLISNLDARSYVERKRGLHELAEDPLVTAWMPADYTPRGGETPGAGQIRLESRLKLWYNLEDDRAGIRRKVRNLLHEMTGRENPWRDNEDRCVRVVIFGSVAGGTGSGGFLPMAYLLKQMVEDAGWGRPNVTAVLSLPTTFLQKVRPHLHKDIKANGYAALKELEYLTRQLAYAGGSDELAFHYDPGTSDRARRFVRTRPFIMTYLIDRPDALSIERYEHAVADAAYLQMFSPLLGAQAGEYDNYEKHQRTLANGHFSTHWGTFGTALLQLPRNDLLRYAGLRYVSRVLREFLCFGGDDPQFRVPYGDPAFERLAPEEKNRRIDEKFEAYVASRAQTEEQNDEIGVFTAIQGQVGKGGVPLRQAFTEKLKSIYGRLDELIEINEVAPTSVNPGNPSIGHAISVLRREYAESRTRVRGEYLEAQVADIRNGRFLASFFKDYEVNPIAQRLFLIRMLREAHTVPFDDAEDGEFLFQEASKIDLDSQEAQQERERREQELQRSAQQGLFGRMMDSENKAFAAAKRRALQTVNEWVQDHIDDLRRYFWKTFEGELRQMANTLLSSFRKVAEVADEHARLSEAETERFRRDPGAFPDSDVAQYYLDAEVLRDDRRRERLWNLFYLHHLDKGAFFDPTRIFPLVTAAFQPVRDPDGRVRARDAGEIAEVVKQEVLVQAKEVYARALEELRLDLASGLDLEQRYVALLDAGADLGELRSKGKLDDAVRGVDAEVVRKGVEDRLKRLAEECVLLAHVDASKSDDRSVVPATIFYAGLASGFRTDEPDSLGRVLGNVVSGLNFVDGWEERDALVLYRALLGVPIYWFKNVKTELESAYKTVWEDPHREYPLHIEAAWERDPGLPNLDPVEIRRAVERQRAEEAARAAQGQRAGRVRAFTLCALFGGISRRDEAYLWTLSGVEKPLGTGRSAAFQAFEALDPDLRADLEGAARASYAQGAAERTTRAKLGEQLGTHARQLKDLFAQAAAAEKDAEMRFLKEERAVVDELIAEVGGPGSA